MAENIFPQDLPGAIPKPERSRGGGRGSRRDRNERRRNNNVNREPRESTESHDVQIVFKPSFGHYAGATGVGCRGFLSYLEAFLARLGSIAQRPLALLLTEANTATYTKVSLYLLYVKLCSSQDQFETVVPGMTLRGVLSTSDKHLAAGLCTSIPSALAFALNTFGLLRVDDQSICPLLPPHLQIAPALNACSFDFILHYVHQHAFDPVPAAFRPAVQALAAFLPNWNVTDDWMFEGFTTNFWNEVTPAQWTTFAEINAAARAQQLSVSDFSLLSPYGHASQIVRMQGITAPTDLQPFYANHTVTEQDIIRALAVRPGDDSAMFEVVDRFRIEPRLALIRGVETPASAQQAALLALAVRQ